MPGSLLQFNAKDIGTCLAELEDFLEHEFMSMACIQETKLSSSSNFTPLTHYYFTRRDKPGGGDFGLLSPVHHSLSFTPLDISSLLTDVIKTQNQFPADSSNHSQSLS